MGDKSDGAINKIGNVSRSSVAQGNNASAGNVVASNLYVFNDKSMISAVDEFNNVYRTAVIEKYYFQYYVQSTRKILFVLRVLLALTSCAGIASWSVWQKQPLIWAAIVGIAQITAIVNQFLPYVKREASAAYVIPEYEYLINNIEKTKDMIKLNASVVDIYNSKNEYDKRILDIQNKYGATKLFPMRQNLSIKAAKIADEYISQKYS